MKEPVTGKVVIGGWTVEPSLDRLWRGNNKIGLEPRQMDVLMYLAERRGEVVSADILIGEIWKGTMVSDDAVYQCISKLREALGDDSHSPSYIETIPKRGYRLIAPVFPVDKAGTARGVTSVSDIAVAIRSSRRMAAFAVIGLMLALLGYGIVNSYWNVAKTNDGPSIAVIPFLDLSPEGDQEYFADGIAEDLLNALARVPQLRVVGRTSSFTFRDRNEDLRLIGETLGVAHVLEGSVRKDGTRVRVTAQLIDAKTGYHLWSGTYDREMTDIFAIQEEISAAIVAALSEALVLKGRKAPQILTTANAKAYEAYLRGQHLVAQRTKTTVERAVREFEKAIALDPNYALAHAELALATLLLQHGSYRVLTKSEAIARAAPHAEKALVLAPSLAEAHAATGFVLWIQQEPEESLTHFRQAIEINPNYSVVYNWMAILLGNYLGRYDEAFTMRETALRLDPLSVPTMANNIMDLIDRQRLEEADRGLEEFASIAPPALLAILRGRRTSDCGKWADAVLANLDALQISPDSARARINLAGAFAAIGLEKEALASSKIPLLNVLRRLGRSGASVTMAEKRLAEEPDALLARRDLALALAGAGNYVRARPVLEDLWQRSGRRVTIWGLFDTDSATALISILRAAGDEANVDELLAALRDDVRRQREAGIVAPYVDYWEGIAAFLSGDREKGLALISSAVNEGEFFWLNEAYLQNFYNDPGFAAIRAAQEAREKAERDRFLRVVCTDNPYTAVWQPAEGTCEGIAATDGN